MKKDTLGFILILIGVVLGLFLGIWVCFIGGIVQVFSNIDPLNFIQIGWGLAKFFSSGIVGWASAAIFILPGITLIND